MTPFISSTSKIWSGFSTPSIATQDSLSKYVDYIKTTNFKKTDYKEQLSELVSGIIGEKSFEFADLPSLDTKQKWFSPSQLSGKQTYLIVICFLIHKHIMQQEHPTSPPQLNWKDLNAWFYSILEEAITNPENQPMQKKDFHHYQLNHSSFASLNLTEIKNKGLALVIGNYILFRFDKLKTNQAANKLRNPHIKTHSPTHGWENRCRALNAYYLLALYDSINAPNSTIHKNHQLKLIEKEDYAQPSKTINSYLCNSASRDIGDLLWIGDVVCYANPQSDEQLSIAKTILLGAVILATDKKTQLYQKIYSYYHVMTIILKRVAKEIKVLFLDPSGTHIYAAFALAMTDISLHSSQLIESNFDNHQILLQKIDTLLRKRDPKSGLLYLPSIRSDSIPEMTVKFYYAKTDLKSCPDIGKRLLELQQNFAKKYQKLNRYVDSSNKHNLDPLAYAIKLYNEPIITSLLETQVTSSSAIIRAILVPIHTELLEKIIVAHQKNINDPLNDPDFKNVYEIQDTSPGFAYCSEHKLPLTLAILYKNLSAIKLLLEYGADTSQAVSLISNIHNFPEHKLSTNYVQEVSKLIHHASKSRKQCV